MKKILRVLLSPLALILILMLAQAALFAWIILAFGLNYTAAFLALMVLSVILGIILFDKAASPPSYKLMWLWIFMLLPLAGELMYFVWGRPGLFKKKEGRYLAIDRRCAAAQPDDSALQLWLQSADGGLACQARYLRACGNALYEGTRVRYFGRGDELYTALLERLGKAKRSVWLEYFIYNSESASWQTILRLLREKAAAGLDVRVIFDSVGSLFFLPPYYVQTLRHWGIRCYEFNAVHFTLHISDYAFLNHRDHRKLFIIDGEVGFTGGVNMADEYFGMAQPYGQWKDASLMLEGPAVRAFTCTFLKMWSALSGETADFAACLPAPALPDGGTLVQPYDDTPLDAEAVSQNAYANMLHHAHRYVWITTPYLIPDQQLIDALRLAARSGVEVRLITPGIPDKKTVFLVTRSYYAQLIADGVRIYEYTPGFIHSKVYLCDDKVAIVGSANMDFRSLYLHFENGCAVYGGQAIADIRADFERTLMSCHEITREDLHFSLWVRCKQLVLRFVAPLL